MHYYYAERQPVWINGAFWHAALLRGNRNRKGAIFVQAKDEDDRAQWLEALGYKPEDELADLMRKKRLDAADLARLEQISSSNPCFIKTKKKFSVF